MNVLQQDATEPTGFQVSGSVRWWDSDTGCTIVAARPSVESELWTRYLEGAQHSYCKHGIESVVDVASIESGLDTVLFYAAVDATGRVVGGMRAKGPYRSADESHAIVEWSGHPSLPAVRKMITDRLKFGVVEMKTAWVTDDPRLNGALTKTLARAGIQSMNLLGIQFVMATSAGHVLDRWRSSGGVVAAIPAVPYPDERYRTKLMFWDRTTFAQFAEPRQLAKIHAEKSQLDRCSDRPSEVSPLHRIGL